MKRIITILLALVMVLSCSLTAMAYTAVDTRVKIIDSNGIRDITSKLGNRYITDNENLMIPAEITYKEMGLTQIEWGIRDKVKVLCAVNPIDNWNTGVNYAEYPTYSANGEVAGTLDPTPVFQDGIAMIAIQNLEKLWKIPVKFDANTKTYYIVMDKNKMGSTVADLPDAETGENLMAVKKSNSNPNTIKVNLVINGKSKDITTTAIPQNSNGKLMINVKPILRSLDAVIIQNKENYLWGGHRSSDSRLFVVYYDTGVIAHGYNNGVTLDGVYATVNPKLIDDKLLLYYKDIESLTGGVVNYDTKTKTCTISITDEWLANNSVAFDATPSTTTENKTQQQVPAQNKPTTPNTNNQKPVSNSSNVYDKKNDDRVSPEQFAKNKTLQAAYYRLACDIIREELKYPNTAVFSSNYKVTKMQSDGTTSSFVKSLERQFGTKLDKDFIELLDEINEETGANEPSETVKVDGYVKAQNGFGLMKEVSFWMTFDVLNRTVNYIMFDGEPVWHYTTDKKGNVKLHEPSYSLKGYYY